MAGSENAVTAVPRWQPLAELPSHRYSNLVAAGEPLPRARPTRGVKLT